MGLFSRSKSKEKKKGQHEHYFDLKVKEVIRETPDAITIIFEQPENKMDYKSGQFLTLILTMDGQEVRRSYSLNTSPYVDESLAVTVKRVEGGLVSNHLVDNLQAGETIKVMEAMGNFTTEFDKNNKRHVMMFGGGSGITPFMSLIKSTLHMEPDSIATLIYCNRDVDSIIFYSKLEEMQTMHEGRLHVIHVLDNAPMNWQGHSGLLNHDMLEKIMERIPDWGIDNTTFLMCGPEGMMENVRNLLTERGIPGEKIFKESFVTPILHKDEKPAVEGEIVAQTVKVVYDDEEHEFEVPPDSTILLTALDLGIDLPYSCQSGLCTACRGKLISGEVKLDEEEGLSEAERNDGYVLTCVGHPLTPDVKIEIG